MQIHVVQSGQTLYGIARTYGISVADLSAANQINPIQTLVIGQALVIPISGMYYFVQPGDTLYKIGRRFGVNHLRLAQMNAINPIDPLQIGFRLYIPPAPKTPVESNAYVEAVTGALQMQPLLPWLSMRLCLLIWPLSALKRGLTEASPRLMFPRSRARQRAAGQC